MKLKTYIAALLTGMVCVALSIALIAITTLNQRQQARLQARQQQLNAGLLGPEAQQISQQLLQDLAQTATTNRQLRDILVSHGYQLGAPAAPGSQPEPAANASATAGEEPP